MASLLDIENNLSDETTQEIVLKDWYWNEFLPKIDEDNIRNDYRLVYQEFSEHEWMSLPYNYPEHAWQWLLENKILVLSRYDDSDLYGWYEKYEYQPKSNVDDCYKYRLTNKFFEDYQMSIIKRRSTEASESFESWLYYLDVMQKYGFVSSTKNYEWPTIYKQVF
jgi:hypothetical protein